MEPDRSCSQNSKRAYILNSVGKWGTRSLGMCGSNMIRAVKAADTTVVDVSSCKHNSRLVHSCVSRIWYKCGGCPWIKAQKNRRSGFRCSLFTKSLLSEAKNSWTKVSGYLTGRKQEDKLWVFFFQIDPMLLEEAAHCVPMTCFPRYGQDRSCLSKWRGVGR